MSLVVPSLSGLSFGGTGVPTVPPLHPASFSVNPNMSGAENPYPTWVTLEELTYWAARGAKYFRLPLLWDAIQPSLSGPLDTTSAQYDPTNSGQHTTSYMGCVSQVLANAASVGLKLLVDVHASGRWKGNVIGAGVVAVSDFVNLWSRLSAFFAADPHYAAVRGYDVNNEWHDMDPSTNDGVDPATPYAKALVLACNQGALNAIRANGFTGPVHLEWLHYSGAWDIVENCGDDIVQIVDSANNWYLHVHCYPDRDSSGTHFVYAEEAASAGYAPPGLSTNPMILAQRLARVVPWAAARGIKVCWGETGVGNDVPTSQYPTGSDDSGPWNIVLRNGLLYAQAHDVETYYWGAGPGFDPTYPYCPEPLNLGNPYAKDFTATGFQATQMAVLAEFMGSTAAQPTAYRVELPFAGGATQLYALPLGTALGSTGFPFRPKFNGTRAASVTFTPHAYLADGTTSAPGVTFTPASITVAPGINVAGSFTMTATQAQTMLIGCTNDAGLTDPPLLAVSSINDFFRQIGDVDAPIFALRREYTVYVGPGLNLMRASDGARRDFFFDNIGNLPRQAIQDWAASRRVRIMTNYDQSNNGRHANVASGKSAAVLNMTGTYPAIDFGDGIGYDFAFDVHGARELSFAADLNAPFYDTFLRQDYYNGGPFSFSPENWTINDPRTGGTGFVENVQSSVPASAWHQVAATFKANAAGGQKLFLDGAQTAVADTLGAYTELHTEGDYGNDQKVQFGYFEYYGGSRFPGSFRALRGWHKARTAAELQLLKSINDAYYATPLPDTLTAVAPTVSGAGPARVYQASGQAALFSAIVIADDNNGSPTDAATITLSGATATLSGTGLSGSNPYTLAADTAANLQAKLRALTIQTTATIGATVTATINVTSSAGTSTTNAATIVTVSAYGTETPFAAPAHTFVPVSLKGYNLAGGENFPSPIYPRQFQVDYAAKMGFGLIRLPINHGAVITLGTDGNGIFGPIKADHLSLMRAVIDRALHRNLYVVIDLHNYGAVVAPHGYVQVGVDAGATDSLADFWSRCASAFTHYPNVIFGLMNEPGGGAQTAQVWHDGCLPAIGAIRATGATQKILIPGVDASGAHSWTSSGNAAAWAGFNTTSSGPNRDPANNFAFEMHQYLDGDNSGTHAYAVAGKGATVLDADSATSWCRAHGFNAFLGEFGFAPNAWKPNSSNEMAYDPAAATVATGGQTEGAALLQSMLSNADVWIGWSAWVAGDFGTPPNAGGYAYSVEPASANNVYTGADQPQMATLLANRGYTFTPPAPAVIWRIQATAQGVNAGGVLALNEVGFHTTAGGSQVANSANCIVSTPGFQNADFFSGYLARNLIDGDESSLPGSWVGYGYGFPFDWDFEFAADPGIVEMKLSPESDGPPAIDRNPTDFTIQRSYDGGATWTTRATRTGQTWGTDSARVPMTTTV